MAKPSKSGTGSGSTIRGSKGDDKFFASSGDQIYIGSSGTDTLIISGSVFDYDWEKSFDRKYDWELTDTTGTTGTDLLSGVEILQFDDATITLGQDVPMEIFDVPEQFVMYEDETSSFTFTVRDVDDHKLSAVFENGFYYSSDDYGSMTIDRQGIYDLRGPHSLQRIVTFTYAYDNDEFSLAEGEEYILPVTVFITTSSSDDFFGLTEEETKEITFEVVIIGKNDAPTIHGTAEFTAMNDLESQGFDLSALGDDIDSDDDGSTLNYEIVNISQTKTDYRMPFTIYTEGSNLYMTPDGLPAGMTTDEQSWAEVELIAIDGHGAYSEGTVTVNLTMQGTATHSERALLLNAEGEIDLSSLNGLNSESYDYGSTTLFNHPNYSNPDLTDMLSFTLVDDIKFMTLGKIANYSFRTDVTEESSFGTGADTLVFNFTGEDQQFFSMSSIVTGYGEDAVVIQMSGATEASLHGLSISTGAQSDQVIIDVEASDLSWFITDMYTGSGHDLVDINFMLTAQDFSQALIRTSIYTGSGDDTLNFVFSNADGAETAYSSEILFSTGEGDDFVYFDTSELHGYSWSEDDPYGDLYQETNPGAINAVIDLGEGNDQLEIALGEDGSEGGVVFIDGGSYLADEDDLDIVTLLNLIEDDVTLGTYEGNDGETYSSFTTDSGQIIAFDNVDEFHFSDGAIFLA